MEWHREGKINDREVRRTEDKKKEGRKEGKRDVSGKREEKIYINTIIQVHCHILT